MKKLFILLFISTLCACSHTTESEFSEEQKEVIKSEILDVTTKWVNDNIKMSPDDIIEFWDYSSDLMFAENGEFFPNRDSIYNYLKGFYSQTKSMNVEWKERIVIPLSPSSATMSGSFHAKAVFNSGESFEVQPIFTGVFIKKNDKWVLVHGHESFK